MSKKNNRMTCLIDGEKIEIVEIYPKYFTRNLIEVETDDGDTFVLAESDIQAGEEVREQWAYMAEHDQSEFVSMVGGETLVQWALGKPAGPGTSKVNSLGEWLDLWLDTPAEELATYDNIERDVTNPSKSLVNALNWRPTVAYKR